MHVCSCGTSEGWTIEGCSWRPWQANEPALVQFGEARRKVTVGTKKSGTASAAAPAFGPSARGLASVAQHRPHLRIDVSPIDIDSAIHQFALDAQELRRRAVDTVTIAACPLRQGRKKRHYHPPSLILRWTIPLPCDGPRTQGVLACVELTIEPLDLVVQRYPDRRYDLQTSVFKDIGVRMLRLPLEDDAVAFNQKLFDLRPKQHDHGREPIIERPRRMIEIDGKSVEHADDVGCSVPCFSGDPAIGREQPLRHPCRSHRDRDQMGWGVFVRCRSSEVPHLGMATTGWHSLRSHEQMEMPVVRLVPFVRRMGMEVILRVRLGIAHVVRRIMFPLD